MLTIDEEKFERLLKEESSSSESLVQRRWIYMMEAEVPVILNLLKRCVIKKKQKRDDYD